MVPTISKVVTLSAAVFTYGLFPRQTAHCQPVLNNQINQQSKWYIPRTFEYCMQLLNKGCHWVIQSSNFYQANVKQSGFRNNNALFQLMRANQCADIGVCTGDSSDKEMQVHHDVPIMRVVSFYPNITSDEVYSHLLDLQQRLKWDANYQHYVKFDQHCNCNNTDNSAIKTTIGDVVNLNDDNSNIHPILNHEGSMLQLQNITRPIQRFTKKRAVCNGNVCSLQSDVTVSQRDHGWFAHRVGNSMMRRLGIHSRLFVYQRLSYKYEYMPHDQKSENNHQCTNQRKSIIRNNDNAAYDVLYNGTRERINNCVSTCRNFRQWWMCLLSGTTSELVQMHYQHILLLPLADICKQLLQRPNLLNEVASSQGITSSSSTQLMYDILKRNSQLQKVNANHVPGTLLVITSVNDVHVPHYLPQWIQKKIASSVGWYAHRTLQQAILQSKNEKQV